MKYIWFTLITIVASLILSGCGGNPAQDVYEHLESAVELEKPFEEQQQSLYQAEERENELFEEIITIGTSELSEVEPLVEEALASIDSRLSMVEIEEESIEASYQEFHKIEQYSDQLDETDLKQSFVALVDTMNARYDAYQLLNEAYNDAAKADQELFQAFLDEDLTFDQLQEHVDIVNEKYAEVDQYTQSFNEATDSYNENKRIFYEESDLNISYE